MDYVDVVEHLVDYLAERYKDDGIEVVGGEIPSGYGERVVSLKLAGGSPNTAEPFTRVRILTRAETDLEATALAIVAMNTLQNEFEFITGFNIKNLRVDSYPVDAIDDSGKRESWCYILVYHLEA